MRDRWWTKSAGRAALAAWLFLGLGLVACRSKPEQPLLEAAKACAAHDSELSCPRPIFNVRSLKASIAYYRDVLGFKLDWVDGDPPDFGSVSRGHTILFMCQGCQGTPGAWLMTLSPDVDKLYREWSGKKARIRMPPTNMPWHIREMHVADLDGNVLRIGSPMEH